MKMERPNIFSLENEPVYTEEVTTSEEDIPNFNKEDQIPMELLTSKEKVRQVYSGTKFLIKRRTLRCPSLYALS